MHNNIIIYQKGNGEIFSRVRKSTIGLEVGKETSMGWKVLSILYEHEGNYYTFPDWCRILRGEQIKHREKKRFLKFIIKQLNKLI